MTSGQPNRLHIAWRVAPITGSGEPDDRSLHAFGRASRSLAYVLNLDSLQKYFEATN